MVLLKEKKHPRKRGRKQFIRVIQLEIKSCKKGSLPDKVLIQRNYLSTWELVTLFGLFRDVLAFLCVQGHLPLRCTTMHKNINKPHNVARKYVKSTVLRACLKVETFGLFTWFQRFSDFLPNVIRAYPICWSVNARLQGVWYMYQLFVCFNWWFSFSFYQIKILLTNQSSIIQYRGHWRILPTKLG